MPTTPDPTAGLSGAQKDAYLALKNQFEMFGLGSLAAKILEFVRNGYSGDTITILLQETPEYKQRFAGNELRRKAGLGVLTPREYLSVEAAYRQILSSAGLPTGFYDQHSDFVSWIGTDVSPSEIKDRVDMAVQATTLADDTYKVALRQLGFDQGHLVAAFLDTKRAMPLLQKQVRTAEIGSEALRQNLTFDAARAQQFALSGVSRQQAQQAYQAIGSFLPDATKLGDIYGEDYTQTTAEDEFLGGSGEASRKRKRLGEKETATFSGAGGVGRSTLSKSSKGSY